MHIPARHFAFVILSWFLLCAPALAQQVDNLKKNLSTGNINTGFDLPTGQTIRIESGATIIADAGSTVTGFGSGGTWGSITGTLSAQTDLATALGLKLAAASNLSDLASASTARTNLGLGSLATLSEVGSAQITNGSILGEDINAAANIALGALGSIAFETTGVIINSAGIVTEGFVEAATLGGNGAAITALNASNLTTGTVAAARMPALTGDITTSSGAVATTLATVNSNVGSFTNASITVNAKGLITAASSGSAGATLGANTFTGAQTITDATGSTSTTTGALKVTGGIGTQGSIYAANFLAPSGGIRAGDAYINTATDVMELYDNNFVIKLGVDTASVHLAREADRTLGVRNGTNPAAIRVFETDSGANDEYLEISATSTTNTIKPVASGTGTASAVRYYTTTTVWIGSGSGSPESVEAAGIGSLYTDTATGTLYRKTSGTGNTGWVTP